jgi:hypothetical protein
MRVMRIGSTFFAVALIAGCGDRNPTMVDVSPQFSEAFSAQASTLEWQQRARELISAGTFSPMAAGRIYAALSVAQFNAVSAANSQLPASAEQSDGFGSGGRSAYETRRGAIAGASMRVLGFFFPNAGVSLNDLLLTVARAGPGEEVHPQFAAGITIGRVAGDASIRHVQNDGFTAPWTGTVRVGTGVWVPNGAPALPMLGFVTPYFMASGSQYRPAPPPAYLSADFNAALAEIRAFSDARTQAQIDDARFWNSGAGTPTPPGYFNGVAAAYVTEQRLDETASAEVFAVMHAAVFDAMIACWDAKYHYWVMRPSQVDGAITLPLGLPNHPSYPSGHSCVSAAAGTVLTHFFDDHRDDLSRIVTAAGMSRMVGGIHYRFDITAGNEIGLAVGRLAIERGF